MGRLPFSFHPVLIFGDLADALFLNFRTHCSNLSAPIVVDHSGYFGGTTDKFMCGKSTLAHDRQLMTIPKYSADLVTALISGTRPGMNTL